MYKYKRGHNIERGQYNAASPTGWVFSQDSPHPDSLLLGGRLRPVQTPRPEDGMGNSL